MVNRPSRSDYERHLSTLQRLLEIPATDLKSALTHASDALAAAVRADKVDAFILDPARDSLVAVGTSTQPLSVLERQLGLDVLPLSNGGTTVDVFRGGRIFHSGNLVADEGELRGIREGLKVQSIVAVPLEIESRRRGIVLVSSLQRDFFSPLDAALVASAARWIGSVAERAELVETIERAAVEQGRRSTAEEVVTVLAHDIRNYLQPLVWRLHTLERRAGSDGRADDVADIHTLQSGVGQLTALVGNLLDTARLDSGLYELQLQPVDLARLANQAAADAASAEHRINVQSPDSLFIAADPVRLRQCIANILSNALAHSPRDAPVHVSVTRENASDGAYARIDIVDEGPGIPDAILPHVFEKFFSASSTGHGLGLGLYVAKRIASAHRGDITADRYEGKGARFTLRLPALP
jgi:signal transduction histidine kinase